MRLQKYIRVMYTGIQNEMEYRANFLMSLFFSLIPFAVNILIWFAVSDFSESKFGLSLNGIVSYYFVILIVHNLTKSNIVWSIANDIKNGDINKYLIKTIDYLAYQFFLDMPKRAVFFILGVPPWIILGFCLKGYLEINVSFKTIAYFTLALILGYTINFLINFLISISSFYFSEVTGLFTSYNIVSDIISGKIFPLSILPKRLFQFFTFAPFQFISYFPAIILLNKLTDKEVINNFILELLWIVILFVICRIVWRKGLRNYSAYGG